MKKALALVLLLAAACTDNIEIIRGGDFTVETEPYRQNISPGETREITMEIITESEYSGTVYRIRHYKTEGEGTLEMDDGRMMSEGKDYLLSDKRFSVRYTSASETDHIFEVTVSDNLSHSHKIKIELAGR